VWLQYLGKVETGVVWGGKYEAGLFAFSSLAYRVKGAQRSV